jgi:uncharacterized repeat protein (TIGR03803 family)
VQGADGGLYGSTIIGGTFGLGVLFRIDETAAPAAQPDADTDGTDTHAGQRRW